MVKIEVFSNVLKNRALDFFYFLFIVISNPSLTHGANRMSGKNLVSRYLGPSQGRGRCRALRDHFSNANISGTKRANRNPIGFSKSRKMDLSDHSMSNFAYLYSFTPKIGTENRVRAVLEFGEKLRVFLLLQNPSLDFFDFLQESIG